MEDLAGAVVTWIGERGAWAPLAVFLVAFVESLPVIGLFLPGSALLLGVGVLIGMGAIGLWPALLATIAGAVLGDALGYWVARALGPAAIRRHLPSRYRRGYLRGAALFRRWGWAAVFVSRFLSPLRAFAPLVAGVTRMSEFRFQAANIVSALLWAPLLLVLPATAVRELPALLDDRWEALAIAVVALGAVAAWAGLARAMARAAP